MGLSNGSEVFPTAVNLSLPFTPDFAEDNLFTGGWTIGVVYSFRRWNYITVSPNRPPSSPLTTKPVAAWLATQTERPWR